MKEESVKVMLEERICKHCYKTFMFRSNRSKRAKGLFCSIDCANYRGTLQERFDKYIGLKQQNGCILWNGFLDNKGYACLGNIKAYRLSYELFRGAFNKSLFVCHKCDNPQCINPNHLFLGTHQENMDDMKIKGRGHLGEKHGMAKLTNEEVLEMRKMFECGNISMRKLGRLFGVAYATARNIIKRKYWKHI